MSLWFSPQLLKQPQNSSFLTFLPFKIPLLSGILNGRISISRVLSKDNHLSRSRFASGFKRIISARLANSYPDKSRKTSLLAAGRVYLLSLSPEITAGSYPAHFTLTLINQGGIVSVALSLGSPPVAASNCRVLCCPDFPPAQ